MPNEDKKLTDEKVDALLSYMGRHAPFPVGDPEARSRAIARAKSRFETRRQRRQRLTLALAVAAIMLVMVSPVYYRVFIRQQVFPSGQSVAGMTGEIPAPRLAEIMELELARRQQDAILATAVAKDFSGRDNYVNAALAVYQHRSRTVARLPSLLARPVEEGREFNEAVICYGARLLAKTQQSTVPILPVNGNRFPETAGQHRRLDKETYYLAQDAVGQLCEMLRTPEENRVREPLLLAVLEYAASSKRPLPESVRQELSSTFGMLPIFIVVTVRVDEGASSRGWIRFLLWDAQGRSEPQSVEAPFGWSSLPLPLFDAFQHPSQEDDNVKVSSGTADEVVITFTGKGGDARVSFSNAQGLPVAKRFPGRLVELCFEAQVESREGRKLPHVQFGSGGEAGVFHTATPPMELGTTWRQVSIPVDLRGADKWTNGLFVQVISLATGERISVRIRNAYIRSVDSPQSGKQDPSQGRSGYENVQPS